MPCANLWVNNFTGPSYYAYTCWEDSGGGGGDIQRPPGGSGSRSSGISTGSATGIDLLNPPEPIVTANPIHSGPSGTTPAQNFGWNSGAHSIEVKPANWVGRVEFDIPDVQGSRPGGVAIGLAPESALPTQYRDGYTHLQYGLVFTATKLKVIHDGAVVLELSYPDDVRPNRAGGASTDTVVALLYGDYIKWVVNGVQTYAGPFSMSEQFALDATLYTAFDAVDNPAFIAGDWGGARPELEDGSLNGALPAMAMTGNVLFTTELVAELPRLAAKLSENAYAEMDAVLPVMRMTSGFSDFVQAALPRMTMRAYETSTYGAIEVTMPRMTAVASMREPDGDVVYSVLAPSLPRMGMNGAFVVRAEIDTALPALYMRASAEVTYSELATSLPPLGMLAYGGENTPLVQIKEVVGGRAPFYLGVRIYLAMVERVGGGVSFMLQAVSHANAVERVSAEDTWTAMQTVLADVVEQLGLIDRVRVLSFDAGGAIDDSEAWVLHAGNNATTRYDRYGFNSFARVGEKHYGMKLDGVYLLEGADDAGRAIQSGVSFGQHDFGTQALKHIKGVYAGVSSTGALYLRVGDGCREYTYRARRVDQRMKVQRFDIGSGFRSNYYTFELMSHRESMELDSITFHTLATSRRI